MASARETLVFRPLHDTLIEDCLDNAAYALGEAPRSRPWSLWVRTLRNGAPAIQRLQRIVIRARKIAPPPATDQQRRWARNSDMWQDVVKVLVTATPVVALS